MEGYEKYVWRNPVGNDLKEWQESSDSPTCDLDRIGQEYN